jgi:hypothetical protein
MGKVRKLQGFRGRNKKMGRKEQTKTEEDQRELSQDSMAGR